MSPLCLPSFSLTEPSHFEDGLEDNNPSDPGARTSQPVPVSDDLIAQATSRLELMVAAAALEDAQPNHSTDSLYTATLREDPREDSASATPPPPGNGRTSPTPAAASPIPAAASRATPTGWAVWNHTPFGPSYLTWNDENGFPHRRRPTRGGSVVTVPAIHSGTYGRGCCGNGRIEQIVAEDRLLRGDVRVNMPVESSLE